MDTLIILIILLLYLPFALGTGVWMAVKAEERGETTPGFWGVAGTLFAPGVYFIIVIGVIVFAFEWVAKKIVYRNAVWK